MNRQTEARAQGAGLARTGAGRAWERAGLVALFLALLALWERGGIVLLPEALPALELKRRRMEPCFFGFEDPESLSALCFGALPGHYLIRALLDSYGEEHIHNQAFLPLSARLRDLLITRFGLVMNGRRQTLEEGVVVHLPSVLCYDLHDGENCCKHAHVAPEGCEAVSGKVLAFWSQRLLENWNLYKAQRDRAAPAAKAPAPPAPSPERLEEARRQVAQLYENSTSWKVTRPLRALGRLWKKPAAHS